MYLCGKAVVETNWYKDKKTIPLAACENIYVGITLLPYG